MQFLSVIRNNKKKFYSYVYIIYLMSSISWFLVETYLISILFDPRIDLLRRFKVAKSLRHLNVRARLFEKAAPAGWERETTRSNDGQCLVYEPLKIRERTASPSITTFYLPVFRLHEKISRFGGKLKGKDERKYRKKSNLKTLNCTKNKGKKITKK